MNITTLIEFIREHFKVPSLSDKDGLRAWLVAFNTWMMQIATFTNIEVDDHLVRFLQAVLGDPAAWDEFYKLLLDLSGTDTKVMASKPSFESYPALAHRCEARKIDWQKLIDIAMKLLPLIFMEKE